MSTTLYGHPTCSCVASWLPTFLRLLGKNAIKVRVTQLTGGYSKSGGTHTGGGAIDLIVSSTGPGRTRSQAYRVIEKLARQAGADATWHRPYNWDHAGGVEHCHSTLTGCKHKSKAAKAQLVSVRRGRNGLARQLADPGFRPLSGRTWIEGLHWMEAQLDDDRWAKVGLVNHGLAARALAKPAEAARWLKRRSGAMALATSLNADIIGGIECGSGIYLSYITKAYEKAGYDRVESGCKARYFFVRGGVHVEATGHFDPPRYKGDDKPAPWIIATVGGSRMMVVLSHLEYRDTSGKTQVKQQKFIVSEALKVAAERKIGKSQIVFMGDLAYEGNKVRDEALEPFGFHDAYELAETKVNVAVKSYNAFKATKNGARDDVIAVLAGPKGKGADCARPVRAMSQRITTKFDHNPLVAVISRQS